MPRSTLDLSVIIPTYNRPVLIRETIESVLTQTLPPKEIIVVDNGPCSSQYVETVRSYGDRVTYLRNDPPGTLGARNAGLGCATSSWVAFLDDDDLWLPDFLVVARDAMNDPRVTVIGADHVKFEGSVRQPASNFDLAPEGYWDGIGPPVDGKVHSFVGKFPLERLLRRIPFYPSSMLMRRDLALEIGGFDLSLTGFITEDIEFLIRLLTAGELSIIWRPMMEYRLHESSYSRGKHRQTVGRWEIFEFVFENHKDMDGRLRAALEKDLPARRAHVFNVAFGLGDHDTMRKVWQIVDKRRRTWRMHLRRLIAAAPAPLAAPLEKILIRSKLSSD